MRKLCLFVVLLALSCCLFAQNYIRPHLYIGGGPALSGAMIALEPSYRITDLIAVGIKAEYALVMLHAHDFHERDLGVINSYSGNVRVYFTDDTDFRGYLGLGAGWYRVKFGKSEQHKLGIYPRIGFDKNHLNVNIDFNILGPLDQPGAPPSWEVAGVKHNNFITVRFAYLIGGMLYRGRG